jgi:hypothetical protein
MVMAEDFPSSTARACTRVRRLAETMLKIVNYSIFRFPEHLRVIDMSPTNWVRRSALSMENTYLLNLFALEKSLCMIPERDHIPTPVLIEKMKIYTQRIEVHRRRHELLDDITIETRNATSRTEILFKHSRGMMDARVSIVNNTSSILRIKAHDCDHRHHGSDLRRQRLFDERELSPAETSLCFLDNPWHSFHGYALLLLPLGQKEVTEKTVQEGEVSAGRCGVERLFI